MIHRLRVHDDQFTLSRTIKNVWENKPIRDQSHLKTLLGANTVVNDPNRDDIFKSILLSALEKYPRSLRDKTGIL